MSDFKPGEIVDIEIKGVRMGESSHIRVTIEDEHGHLWVLPPQAAITRVAPAEWPPQRGDVWRDCDGDPWFAVLEDDDSAVELICSVGGSSYSPEYVAEHHSPLSLVHRETGAEVAES